MGPMVFLFVIAWVGAFVLGAVLHWREHRPERTQAEAMRQACLWYADETHWRRKHFHGRRWRKSAADCDRGARARRALEGGR